MIADTDKIERIIAMAERLHGALEGDIEALKNGQPQSMRSLDPEIERLTMLYTREVTGLNANNTKTAPEGLRRRLAAVTAKFRETLQLHQRLLTRLRNASEGLIKAVADEVDRQRAPMVTYAPPAARTKKAPVAMIFNGVV